MHFGNETLVAVQLQCQHQRQMLRRMPQSMAMHQSHENVVLLLGWKIVEVMYLLKILVPDKSVRIDRIR